MMSFTSCKSPKLASPRKPSLRNRNSSTNFLDRKGDTIEGCHAIQIEFGYESSGAGRARRGRAIARLEHRRIAGASPDHTKARHGESCRSIHSKGGNISRWKMPVIWLMTALVVIAATALNA